MNLSRIVSLLVVGVLSVVGPTGRADTVSAQGAVYDLPSADGDCPNNCRQIPWRGGADVWNGGQLPNLTSVTTCTGLTEGNGTTDNGTAIQNCISAAPANTVVLIPAGMYYVNRTINLKTRVVLRGAGGGPGAQGRWLSSAYHGDTGGTATVTTLKFGSSGGISTPNSSSLGATVSLSSGYTKGSTTLVTSSAPGVAVGDLIVIGSRRVTRTCPPPRPETSGRAPGAASRTRVATS